MGGTGDEKQKGETECLRHWAHHILHAAGHQNMHAKCNGNKFEDALGRLTDVEKKS